MNENIKNKIKLLSKNKQQNSDKYVSINTNSIEYMRQVAKSRGGKCVSKKYKNMSTHLEWECSEGHRWKAQPTCVITRRQWCPRCSKKHAGIKRLNWSYIQLAAKQKGGKVVSKESEYANTHSKLKWRCEYGHEWWADIDSIKNTSRWCPKCNISFGENMSRVVFETIFKKPFNSIRPEWLKIHKDNKALELDGYNESLNLAFEYNGKQHYEENIFSKTKKILKKQQERDVAKKQICEHHDILLIIIPFSEDTEQKIKNYIIKALNEKGYNIDIDKIKIDKANIYKNKRYEKFEKKVKTLGYKLISKYNGYLKPVKLKCSKGHEFSISARSIDRNKGCPVCNGYRKESTETIKLKCKNIGVKFLDVKYISGKRFNTECLVCKKILKLRHSDLSQYKCKCLEKIKDGNKKR